jgi:hypothetical protein
MLLALNVNVVAITEVIAFATASYVDKTMHRLAFRQGLADVSFGLLVGDFGGDNQFDVKVLGVDELLLSVRHVLCNCGLQR